MNCDNQNDRFEKEKQAVRYFKNALDCGIPHAAERLADCYLNARGTLQNDPEQAEAYFVKAAELYAQQGKPMALVELAARAKRRCVRCDGAVQQRCRELSRGEAA